MPRPDIRWWLVRLAQKNVQYAHVFLTPDLLISILASQHDYDSFHGPASFFCPA
jgi:hypothetical protein